VNTPRTTLYRDKKKGKLMGVCAGIADYTGIDALWVRIGLIVALCVAPVSPVVFTAYILAGIFLPRKPDNLYVDKDEQKYWQRVRQNPTRTAHEVRARFRDIDRRIAEVETYYVTSNPRLSAEIERLR
jgi:phage shock protein C